MPDEIEPIARPVVNPQLGNTISDRRDVTEIALTQPVGYGC